MEEGRGQPVRADCLSPTDQTIIPVLWTGSGPLELLLGAEGEYVREIIIDELAKGIDAAVRLNLNNLLTSTRSRLLRFAGVSLSATYAHVYSDGMFLNASVHPPPKCKSLQLVTCAWFAL